MKFIKFCIESINRLFIKYYYSVQLKKGVIGIIYGMHEGGKNCTQCIDGDNIKLILRK